jgi:hypothetical protein
VCVFPNVQKMTRAGALKMHLLLDCCRDERSSAVFSSGGRIGLELPMRPAIGLAIALALLISRGGEAADLTQLAETGGFLLGNAHRCGVPTDRVERAEKVIQGMIGAASRDPDEETAAASRFAQIFLASALPDQGGDALIPPCKMVIAQFERLERHHQQIGVH